MLFVVLFLLVATPLVASFAAQGSGGVPPGRPPTRPQAVCYRLISVEIPGENQQWAKLLIGDKWLTGCLGPAGRCYSQVWVPC
jgi:hypothetical protein